ncbi:MAG: hypothetical protein ACR2JB_19565 [Bryobacteraceae bacterium]
MPDVNGLILSLLRLVFLLQLLQSLFPSGCCQELTAQALQRIAETFTSLWQQEARPSKPLPTAQSDRVVRAARDTYADKVLGVGMPIEQLLEKHLGL